VEKEREELVEKGEEDREDKDIGELEFKLLTEFSSFGSLIYTNKKIVVENFKC
jgi:hypothetical protein